VLGIQGSGQKLAWNGVIKQSGRYFVEFFFIILLEGTKTFKHGRALN